MAAEAKPATATGTMTVTLDNFVRAKTDMYFAAAVRDGGFGKLLHARILAEQSDGKVKR